MNYDLGTVMKAVFSPETYVSTLSPQWLLNRKRAMFVLLLNMQQNENRSNSTTLDHGPIATTCARVVQEMLHKCID
jgi:hypothetical protein